MRWEARWLAGGVDLGDPVTRRSSYEQAVQRLAELADAPPRSQTPSRWRRCARRELSDLQRGVHRRAHGEGWDQLTRAAEKSRPHLLAPLAQVVDWQAVQRDGLDRLLARMRIDEERVAGCDSVPAGLATGLAQWVHLEQRLAALRTELCFRLFWDDIGGEA